MDRGYRLELRQVLDRSRWAGDRPVRSHPRALRRRNHRAHRRGIEESMIHLNPGQPILTAKDLGRKFGERAILTGASFSLQPGDRVGVLGVNGVGKSTLMRILAGRDQEYEGKLHVARGATVGYVSQEPELDFDKKCSRERRAGRRRDPGPCRNATRKFSNPGRIPRS